MAPSSQGEVRLTVKVVPRAAKAALFVDADGVLRARLHAPPVDGAANDELIAMLARTFDLPLRAVTIAGGAQARTKRVTLEGIDARDAAVVIERLSKRG